PKLSTIIRTAVFAIASFTPGALWSQTVNLTLSPTTATVNVGQEFIFGLKVTPPRSGVRWAVNGIAGGNATFGTVTIEGIYKAPLAVPAPNRVTVSVTSTTGSARTEAIVTILPAVSIT